jgi:hypothetical protein
MIEATIVDNVVSATFLGSINIDVDDLALATSSGSNLVGFIQAGTGAVARTVQAKARDVLDARDFGVDPMTAWAGSTNQSTKLQDAIDAAKATFRDLVLTPGAIRIDDPVDCTGMFAGGLKIRGAATGSPNAGTGSVIVGNTGGVCFDFTGSQYCNLEDLVIDSLVFSPPTPSTIGVLYARATTSAYCQYNNLRDVTIRLPTNMAANGGGGNYGVLNLASELHNYHNLKSAADNPLAFLATKPGWLSSPHMTIDTSITSMSACNLSGVTSLTGLSATRPLVALENAKAIAFEHLYGVGSSTFLFDCDGVEGLRVLSGSNELTNHKFMKALNTHNTVIDMYAGAACAGAPIEMPAAFGSIQGLVLRTKFFGTWTFVIDSANVGNVVNGLELYLWGDDGSVAATNLTNTVPPIRPVATGLSTGGLHKPDFVQPRVLDYQRFAAIAAAAAANNSLFLDTATSKISWKDGAGTTTALY